jgi:hypothetical protein
VCCVLYAVCCVRCGLTGAAAVEAFPPPSLSPLLLLLITQARPCRPLPPAPRQQQ